MPDKCLVLGCGSRRERDKVSFYRVPSVTSSVYFPHLNDLSRKRRLAWLTAINRGDLTQSKVANQRVCSKHFTTGKPSKLEDVDHPNWAPSQNMGYEAPAALKRKSDLDRDVADERQKTKKLENYLPVEDDPSLEGADEDTNISGVSTQTDLTLRDIAALIRDQEFAVEKINKLQSKVETCFFGLMEDTKNIAKWTYYTGLQHDIVQSIYEEVEMYIPSTSTTALSTFNQLLLTLIKLRLNLQFEDLAFRFKITPTTASTCFENIVNALYKSLKSFIVWPDPNSHVRNIPFCFKEAFHEKNTVIFDCFEVFIEKPKMLLTQQQCWSNHKHHHTIKFVIGITPAGTICYISRDWGGRTSDKQIVVGSGFLSLVSPGDVILANKGFKIDDSIDIFGAKLIPAFTKVQNQLHPLKITSTENTTRVKVHAEHVIGMLKNKFKIFKGTIPMDMLKINLEETNILYQMIVICSALINIGPSIIPT